MGNKVIFSIHDNVEQLQYSNKVYLTFVTELWKTCSVKSTDALSVKQRETFVFFILPTYIIVQVHLFASFSFHLTNPGIIKENMEVNTDKSLPPPKKILWYLQRPSDSYLVNPDSYLIVYIPKFTSFFFPQIVLWLQMES